jgi:hypothetical protein
MLQLQQKLTLLRQRKKDAAEGQGYSFAAPSGKTKKNLKSLCLRENVLLFLPRSKDAVMNANTTSG